MKYAFLLVLTFLCLGTRTAEARRHCRPAETVYFVPAPPVQQVIVLPAPPVRHVVFVPAPRPRPVFNLGFNLGFLFR